MKVADAIETRIIGENVITQISPDAFRNLDNLYWLFVDMQKQKSMMKQMFSLLQVSSAE